MGESLFFKWLTMKIYLNDLIFRWWWCKERVFIHLMSLFLYCLGIDFCFVPFGILNAFQTKILSVYCVCVCILNYKQCQCYCFSITQSPIIIIVIDDSTSSISLSKSKCVCVWQTLFIQMINVCSILNSLSHRGAAFIHIY